MSAFELIIFDCDGVLVDSEPIANETFRGMLDELGLRISLDDMFERFVGLSMPQCVQLITEMRGTPPPSAFLEDLRERTARALKEHVKPIPGVEQVLDELEIPCCVASSGDYEKMRLTLGATGLLPRFEGRIFSVVDVARPKPAPDIFLYAAQTMGASPGACAVVEDTPTGVQAAVTAGMCAFGFAASTPAHRLEEAGAHYTFSDMARLPALLNAARPCRPADDHGRSSSADPAPDGSR